MMRDTRTTPKKLSHRKVERSRPGIPMPDMQGAASHLVQIIENNLLAGLESGEHSHLVVAEKNLRVVSLPALPGVARQAPTQPQPQIRRATQLRDHWNKGPHSFGLIYMVSGEADLLLSRQIVACRKGDYGFLLPNTWRNQGNVSHWERPEIERADSEILWIFFGQDGAHIHFCCSRGKEHARSPVLFIPDHKLFILVELMSGEVQEENMAASVVQLLWLLLERLLRKLKEAPILLAEHSALSRATGAGVSSVGEQAQNYVDANLSEKLTLSIVARAIHVSRTRLAQEFTAHAGETFGAYLQRRRLEQARHLLVTTSHPVEGISWICGFSNPHYFSTLFRRRLGVTPTQFRMQQKKNDK